MMRDTVVLDARAVSVRLGKSPVLNEVTLSIPRRTVTAIIGPNGSGKSTLLRTLARLLCCWMAQQSPRCPPARWRGRSRRCRSRRAPFPG